MNSSSANWSSGHRGWTTFSSTMTRIAHMMTCSAHIATSKRITARAFFPYPYEAECALLKPRDGMRLLELGCGSGAAAYYLASRYNIEIVCVTNSPVQADICRRRCATFDGGGRG